MQDTFLCQPGFDTIMQTSRENVASSGIFVDKKMYILRVIDSEGKKVDKLKVMGLQIKKTTIPAVIGKKLESFIGRYLRGEEWSTVARDIVDLKTELMETDDYSLLGLPKGIKGIEDYTEAYNRDHNTRLPGHVAAALHYNKSLETYDDKESLVIMSGMKIRVYYLTDKFYGRFISIALPTDLEILPDWFFNDYNVDRKKQIDRLVDRPLKIILNAIGKKPPTANELLFDDLFGF